MPRKRILRRTPPSAFVVSGDGILRSVHDGRISELAERYGLDRDALAGFVEGLAPRWALDERGWRTAQDPAVPEFQAAAARLRAAWRALPLATRSAILSTLGAVHHKLAGQQDVLDLFIEALPLGVEHPQLWRAVDSKRFRGLAPHTRRTVQAIADFWRASTGRSAVPRWSDRTGTTEPTRGARFVIEVLTDVTGTEITTEQLRETLRRRGVRVPKST